MGLHYGPRPKQNERYVDTFVRDLFQQRVLDPVGITISPDVLFYQPEDYRRILDGTIARNGSATRFNEQGILETVGPNVLRRDFDPATGAFLGALAEPQRENITRRNADLTGANWSQEGLASVVASDETKFPAFTLTGGTSGRQCLQDTTSVNNHMLFAQCYFKAGTHDVAVIGGTTTISRYSRFNLTTGVATAGSGHSSAGMTPVGNGWWLCWAQSAAPASSSTLSPGQRFGFGTEFSGLISGSDVEGLTLHMALPQRHDGDPTTTTIAFPTSPIITEGSAVIRPADTLTIPQVGDRRRGFICWEGIMEFDAPTVSVARFPFSRSTGVPQGVRVGNSVVIGTQPNSSSTMTVIVGLDDLRSRLVRIAYFWDADAGQGGISVDGQSAMGVAQLPLDVPIRFGQSAEGSQGKSTTNWIYISYNIPSIEAIEALTGAVL